MKVSKKQRKAFRNNGKRHARKHGEHRRRISNILDSGHKSATMEGRYHLRMMSWRW